VSVLRRLFWPILTCFVLLYPAYFLEDLLRELKAGATNQFYFLFRQGIGSGIWLASAWLLNELIHIAIWDRFSRPVPALLKHIVSIIIFLLAGTGILGFVFGQSVTGIWATSGVVGLVFGFAARSLIADLFSGIAIHLDPPFRIGDWIEWKEGNEELLARVEQINWRSTRVHARDDTKTLFIPNSHLAQVAVVNVFAPHGRTRQFIRVPLDPAVDLKRASRVLLAGALAAEGPLQEPAPDVLLEEVTDKGLIFAIRYWHDPETSISKVRHSVLYSVMLALDHSGIMTARNRHEVLTAPLPNEVAITKDARWILRRVEIFSAFEDREIEAIAAQAQRHELAAGEVVVRQGAPGDSLYFVMEGLLDVTIEQPGKAPLRVNRLLQGQYFGEMSLLTGDPRSATITTSTSAVIYEVAKRVIEPILQARPEVLQELAQTIAMRQLQNQTTLARDNSAASEAHQQTFTAQILGKIRDFFSAH
jgi:small-conductance mechanosensitive channel/CRP-like cAMP-binding protein